MSKSPAEQKPDNMTSVSTDVSGAATDQQLLNQLRQDIDAVDNEIHKLINNRAKLAQKVAVAKKEHLAEQKSDSHPIFYRPEREAQVLKDRMAIGLLLR